MRGCFGLHYFALPSRKSSLRTGRGAASRKAPGQERRAQRSYYKGAPPVQNRALAPT